MDWGSAAAPLAIYIHWPFCRSKCPYCDFNSHVRDGIDAARWTRALLADLDHQAALLPGRTIGSVFFGGGTPSLMPPETVASLLERVKRHWAVTADVEITLEANPNSAEAARFRAFAAAGVNRLSLGVQALDPAALRFLGRAHDRAEAIAAIEHARDNFARFSFDLIYARPGQSIAAWRRELDEALGLAGDHLSLYQLTIEPGTAFATLARRGDLVPPDEDTAAALFETTQDRLAAEVGHRGDQAARHNNLEAADFVRQPAEEDEERRADQQRQRRPAHRPSDIVHACRVRVEEEQRVELPSVPHHALAGGRRRTGRAGRTCCWGSG